MKRKFAWFFLFLGFLLPARGAPAQEEIPFSQIAVSYQFGVAIQIHGKVAPAYWTAPLSIELTFEGEERGRIVGLIVDDSGRFVVSHNMEDGFIPAFTTVTFRFLYPENGAGLQSSQTFSFVYRDNRFAWQSLEEPPFRVHWYEGDAAFARAVLDAARNGREQAERILGVQAGDAVDIYAYASQEDYLFARGQMGQRWAGGHADPTTGLVLLSLPPGEEARLEIEQKIPHEIAHLVLYQASGTGFWNLPAWLNEGFASVMEAFPNPDYDYLVKQSLATDSFIPMTNLCPSFPGDSTAARLAYAESTLFVRYLLETYGPAGLRALVQAYADGASCDRGPLVEPFEAGLSDLEEAWFQSVKSSQAGSLPEAGTIRPTRSSPFVLVLAAVLAVPVLVFLVAWVRVRRKQQAKDYGS